MRLITRADFDGLVCAAILGELGIVKEIFYVHPKDLQDNKIKVTKNDVIAKLPRFTMISVGHSIINRTSNVNVGSLTLQYGGGGHYQVGTCQVNGGEADKIVTEMLQIINQVIF